MRQALPEAPGKFQPRQRLRPRDTEQLPGASPLGELEQNSASYPWYAASQAVGAVVWGQGPFPWALDQCPAFSFFLPPQLSRMLCRE